MLDHRNPVHSHYQSNYTAVYWWFLLCRNLILEALEFSNPASWSGVKPLFFSCKYKAATPATCGVAMEVPLIVYSRHPPPSRLNLDPGANKINTAAPVREAWTRIKSWLLEPTVTPLGTRAWWCITRIGIWVTAANIKTRINCACRAINAAVERRPPPKLMLATEGWCILSNPVHTRYYARCGSWTRTTKLLPTISTFLATPYWLPPKWISCNVGTMPRTVTRISIIIHEIIARNEHARRILVVLTPAVSITYAVTPEPSKLAL